MREPQTTAQRDRARAHSYPNGTSWVHPQQSDPNRPYPLPPLPHFARAPGGAPPFPGYALQSHIPEPHWRGGRPVDNLPQSWGGSNGRDGGRLSLGGGGGADDDDWDRRQAPRHTAPYPSPGDPHPYSNSSINSGFNIPLRSSGSGEFTYTGGPRSLSSGSSVFTYPSPPQFASPPITSTILALSDYSAEESARRERERERSEERPFQCDECPLAFHRGHDLKRHKRIHLEVKPYPCHGCEKRFTRKDALKRHLLVKQHDIRPAPLSPDLDDDPNERSARRPEAPPRLERPSINPLGGSRVLSSSSTSSGVPSWSSSASQPQSYTSASSASTDSSEPHSFTPDPTMMRYPPPHASTVGVSGMEEAMRRREHQQPQQHPHMPPRA